MGLEAKRVMGIFQSLSHRHKIMITPAMNKIDKLQKIYKVLLMSIDRNYKNPVQRTYQLFQVLVFTQEFLIQIMLIKMSLIRYQKYQAMMTQRKRIFRATNNRTPLLLMILRRWCQKEIFQKMVQEVMALGMMVPEMVAHVDLRIKMMINSKAVDNPLQLTINNKIECHKNRK